VTEREGKGRGTRDDGSQRCYAGEGKADFSEKISDIVGREGMGDSR